LGTIVESLPTAPGPARRYVLGLNTIWSISTPSSRTCMRGVWVPFVAKVTAVDLAAVHLTRAHLDQSRWTMAHHSPEKNASIPS
jgi:hypothetical protein